MFIEAELHRKLDQLSVAVNQLRPTVENSKAGSTTSTETTPNELAKVLCNVVPVGWCADHSTPGVKTI